MTRSEKIILSIGGLFLAIIAIVWISHMDMYFISTWAVSLLDHIKDHNLVNYAVDLLNQEEGTNYNFYQNLSVAIWISPLYVISKIINVDVPLIYYQVCIKIVIALLHACCSRELYVIVQKLGFDKRKAFIVGALYFCSPIVLIHGVGIGQIDCLGILCLLLSIRFYLEKKYYRMSIAMGLALLSKVFVIMFYVPIILLNITKIKKMFKYLAIALVIPLIDKLYRTIYITDYSVQADYHNEVSFIPKMFSSVFNFYGSAVILFILLICAVCLFIGRREIKKSYYWLLFPIIIYFIFYSSVFWHPQWSLYMLPILLIIGAYIEDEKEFAFYYFGFNVGFVIYSLSVFNTNYINKMLLEESFMGRYIPGNIAYVSLWISAHISEYVVNVGYTIFIASFLILILLYYASVNEKLKMRLATYENQIKEKSAVPYAIWLCVLFIPVSVYYTVLFLGYFGILS